MSRRIAVLPLLGLLALIAGCGGGGHHPLHPTPTSAPPVVVQSPAPTASPAPAGKAPPPASPGIGFPDFATKNTTRVGGSDPAADAAGVALAVYPSAAPDARPATVALVDGGDWRSAISAAELAGAPLRAPLLLSAHGRLPAAAREALHRLSPAGAKQAGGAQVIRVGDAAPHVSGLKSADVAGGDPAAIARAVDNLQTAAAGSPSRAVIVAGEQNPAFAMPAAGLSARSGAPVLWTKRDSVPKATLAAIKARSKPRMYVIGPAAAVSQKVVKQLGRLGTVKRIFGKDPAANAVAVARYQDGRFGWNVVDPGHGLVIASASRPADAAAAAPLSVSGTYGPLLLVTQAGALPAALQSFLLDIQPGYDKDPVRGVYNHAWLMGDQDAISTAVQSRIDSLLEIQPVDRSQ